ncbi:hypothetical protein EXIGLDRAFT_843683 [Exidia glandulosa HHB12029]|uniref:Uncharacterized protein n=1 Tax=Exidia glandulosa HHB12029 TaxID=1314781 RepID=A0A165CHI6_EXIGL|nr:hypothetical protein EXIGLDRAFT_843683 [Exidia glandulosa HHB12029]
MNHSDIFVTVLLSLVCVALCWLVVFVIHHRRRVNAWIMRPRRGYRRNHDVDNVELGLLAPRASASSPSLQPAPPAPAYAALPRRGEQALGIGDASPAYAAARVQQPHLYE